VNLSILRVIVAVVCGLGIAGMIVGSLADNNNGAVVTFGLVTAVSILVLMAFSYASRSGSGRAGLDETLAARVEDRIQGLVSAGADEGDVRALVGDAVRLGRGEPA
jgi:hypothetical protein